MFRLLLLSAAAAVIVTGFAAPVVVKGAAGYLLAGLLVLTGSAVLWFIERKTASHLDQGGLLNKILNTDEGPD